MEPYPQVDGILPIILPTPPGHDKLKTVNMYAVGKGPITLVDAGAKTPAAFESLKNQLNNAGFGFGDVERIVLSHRHGDHVGMAAKIMESAGHPVECFLHKEDERYMSIEKKTGRVWGWNEQINEFFVNAGMPDPVIKTVRQGYKFLENIADPLDSVSFLENDQVFSAGSHRLKIIYSPGHCPGNCCIYDVDQKILFSGDTIVKHIIPVAVMELNKERLWQSNYLSLKALISTLKRLSKLDIRHVFPGHGESIDNPKPLIDSYLSYYEKIKMRIYKMIRDKKHTIYEMAHKLYGHHEGMAAYFALSEIKVYLEILIDEKQIACLKNHTPFFYHALD